MRAVQIVQFNQIDQIEKAMFNLTGAFSNGLPQCSSVLREAVPMVQFDQIERAFFNLTRAFQMVSHSDKCSCMRAVQMVQFDQIDRIETAIFNLTGAFSNGLPQC